MGRQIVGVFVSALVGLVALLLAIGLAFAISLAGAIDVPPQIHSVLVCLVAAVAAYVAGRIGRTSGATLGVIAVLILEVLLAVFQRTGGTIQMAVYTGPEGIVIAEPRYWFGLRIVIGLVSGAYGQKMWLRKSTRLATVEGEAREGEAPAEPLIELTTDETPKD